MIFYLTKRKAVGFGNLNLKRKAFLGASVGQSLVNTWSEFTFVDIPLITLKRLLYHFLKITIALGKGAELA